MGLLMILVLVLGIWMVASPKSALDAKIKLASRMGAKITVSKVTYKYTRYIGVVLIVVSLLALFG